MSPDRSQYSPKDSLADRPTDLEIDPDYLRRPSLCDVLNNNTSANSPCSLGAFTSFLAQNYCSEVLDFTLAVTAYRQTYESLILRGNQACRSHRVADTYAAWKHILETYIKPSADNEINIPGEVRDELLSHQDPTHPPRPEALEKADTLMRDLMNGIFLQFLENGRKLQKVREEEADSGESDDSGSHSTTSKKPSSSKRRLSSHPHIPSHVHRSHRPPATAPPTTSATPAKPIQHSRHLLQAKIWGHAHANGPTSNPFPAEPEEALPLYRRAHDFFGTTSMYRSIRLRKKTPRGEGLGNDARGKSSPATPPSTPPLDAQGRDQVLIPRSLPHEHWKVPAVAEMHGGWKSDPELMDLSGLSS